MAAMATDDGVDVVDMDEEAPDVDGYLGMAPADKKKPDWKPLWFLLHGSSLFYYKTEIEAKAKGVIQLRDAAVELATGSDATVVIVREATKKGGGWQLKASKAEKAQWWASQLTAARDRKPREMPDREKLAAEAKGSSKRSVAYRAKKALGSKLAASRLGAGTVASFNELTERLVHSIDFLVTAESGSKAKALWVNRGTAKLIVKFFIEMDRGAITNEQLLKVDKPLRASFLGYERLFKNYKRIPAAQMKDLFLETDHNLNEAGRLLREMLRPYVHAKSMMLMQSLQEYVNSAAFWMKLWDMPDPDGKIEHALFDLIQIMIRYTQVELHLDP